MVATLLSMWILTLLSLLDKNGYFNFIFPSFLVEDGFSEDGWWADATLNAIRKTKSAEHIGIKPTIIVNR